MKNLSKSRYVSGLQCNLRLWFDCYQRNLKAPVTKSQQAIFDTGNEVGEFAQKRYPGGVLVEADHFHPDDAIRQTTDLLHDPSVTAIYEAGFKHDGVLVRVDVLERLSNNKWRMVEVKSSTRLKQVHESDVAVQYYVLRGAGVDVVEAGVLTLNNKYVYDGENLDLQQLFKFHDITDDAEEKWLKVSKDITVFKLMLAAESAPDISPGPHCHSPYQCGYFAHCTLHQQTPKHPITDLPALHQNRQVELLEMGVDDVTDIPDDFKLTDIQRRAKYCIETNKEFVSSRLDEAMSAVEFPIYYLDFETCGPAIPRFSGTKPYGASVFQYSLHIESEAGDVTHREYLHPESSDPRRALADRLLEDIGTKGSICVYSGYEATVIKSLVSIFPELATELNALLDRLWDLLPVIRNNFYHKDFRGSFSIKKVLPVLVPELSYEDLEINDGMAAARSWIGSIDTDDLQQRASIHSSLREYCGLDTLAMVRLRHALRSRIKAQSHPI